jgi:pSer/pThr/pTyr-binding forkhead associated (FHA) protein
MVGYSFLVTDGPDLGRSFVLATGVTIIGRLDTSAADDPPGSCRWTLTDPAVSRTHAQITWDGEGPPVLVHLSTTNATLLNGRIVTGQSLEQGQSLQDKQNLRMGQTGLEVQVVERDSAWKVLEGEKELSVSDVRWAESGVIFASNSSGVRVTLTDDSAEAYLLRRLDGTLWSTPLKPDVPVVLAAGDILRLEQRRLLIAGEG